MLHLLAIVALCIFIVERIVHYWIASQPWRQYRREERAHNPDALRWPGKLAIGLVGVGFVIWLADLAAKAFH